MRPVSDESDGPAPLESFLCPLTPVGPLPAAEMSLLHSLGPVQSWLGQELEKCGIDAMIYTRYVLSLLLHDNYDYDLQDQENDILLGWEKGTGKKWAKCKKKGGGTDLSLEEIKKQAAVQCLLSASDENSGIESLVEELCSKLKDIQNKQKEENQLKKSDGSQSPEGVESPSSKDQVEMYYEAFPPLSEKSVCLQEIMTVWNKAKAIAYSGSSSSAAPQTSTDTSSPKDCNSDGEAAKERTPEACSTTTNPTSQRTQQRRSKKEKEKRFHGGATAEDRASVHGKKQVRHRSEGKYRPRSWSSGSSEAGSSSSGNQGDSKTSGSKAGRIKHKSKEVFSRSKRGCHSGQVKLALKAVDKEERRNAGGSSSSATGGPVRKTQLYKKGKRPLKEIRKDPGWWEEKESGAEASNKKEYMEEPLWYTEPITEYLVPFSSRRSKLETKYRSKVDSPEDLTLSTDFGRLSERMQGICIANTSFQRAYLAAGTFVDGHFVEVPGDADEEATELNGTSSCPPPEDSRELDDEYLSEFTHFYEVDIYQSILDPSASDLVQESRILSMIRQKSEEQRDFEAECCLVLDGLDLQGESAIRVGCLDALGDDGFFMQDLENMAQVWACYSSSTSEDIDGESFAGDSPVQLSPALDGVPFTIGTLPGNLEEPHLPEATTGLNSSCLSLFELQYDSPTLPFLTVGHENNTDSSSCLDPHCNKQSRLLIWTKNSAFDETEHCSNLSTRTCSPWSHSEETRSDNEQINVQTEESALIGNEEINCIIPPISGTYLEEEILDFLQENNGHQCEDANVGTVSKPTIAKKSKLESICGIALERDESKQYDAGMFSDDSNQQSDNYSSGIIKDIWTAIGDGDLVLSPGEENPGEGLFSQESSSCGCLDLQTKEVGPIQGPPKKAVQRSEYHLWEEGKNEEQALLDKNQLSKINASGDYMTPSKPWDVNPEKDNTSFILGGVYGELKMFSSDQDWAVVPPGDAKGSLLQCAAASSSGSDVVTIASTDRVFMNTGSCFASSHKTLWRPLVSFGQSDQASKGGEDGLNKGFSFIFHEDLLGSCAGFRGEEPGIDYPFASFDLNNPFSQVLQVECSFEPEDMASFSPGFKPKSILCSDSENEAIHPRLYGINRTTQYRAIRISPRTHFRPISASELSPGGGSESEIESEKEEMSVPVLAPPDVSDDPQADLKPLEEDAENEGPCYGKSELESGKFLPRLKKSGMEKSAQTSLDSQEGSSTLLPIAEQETCLDCETASGQMDVPVDKIQEEESCREKEACKCAAADQSPTYGKTYDFVEDLHEFPLNISGQGLTDIQQDECWWQNTICSPLFPGPQCTGSSNI
ncbi:uncharacterized protein KIAA0232-like [Salvelinus fontinalis]|uniref:uncharacterized protein KIAA0232-like n=1 Tax=Salvelinus fontinalis TaxID=8038 RepID=UPI0024862DAE|nr:uncharacterized protein KIAA0232-like [Salvelinus fontinalis]XP_055794948.1 uncharacterized protein KIAA0232-like [Salvelinus fontinalis]